METQMPPIPSAAPIAAPAEPAARLATLDAARGLALLGILCVNGAFFALPFGWVILYKAPADWPLADKAAYFFVHTFCESKFFPLFSLLFGYGLALQMDRIAASGRPYAGIGVRRLLFLMAVGFLHATLLWYGDILFVYSIVGLLCLIFIRARAKPLLIAGASLLIIASMCMGGFGAFSKFSEQQRNALQAAAEQKKTESPDAETPEAAAPSAPPPAPGSFEATPMGRFFKEMSTGVAGDPSSKVWIDTEIEVYRDGPYLQALMMRCTSWLIMLIVSAFSFGWHILAMFLIGAGLAKARILDPANRAWHKRFALAGLFVGAPMCIFASLAPYYMTDVAGASVAALVTTLFGPVLSLGYLGGMALLVQSNAGGAIGRWFAATGRMAFTNYLTQTVVMTFIMYHWGLGKFAAFGRAELLGIALAVFAAQTVFSNLWLSKFRFGPLEWVWRLWTYGRAERMTRGS